MIFVLTIRRAPVDSITKDGYFDDQGLAKRRLVPIIANSCTLFFYACGDYMWSERKTIRVKVNFLILYKKKKHCRMTCLKWKENRKEHTKEDLFKLSSDNVYLLLVSFCRFHKTFGLNQIVSIRDLLFFFIFNFI